MNTGFAGAIRAAAVGLAWFALVGADGGSAPVAGAPGAVSPTVSSQPLFAAGFKDFDRNVQPSSP